MSIKAYKCLALREKLLSGEANGLSGAKTYRYDTHVHTREISLCGNLTAAETVRQYKEKNFDGIVITDHYEEAFFLKTKDMPWEEQVKSYLRGYYSALECGEMIGITVLPGIELCLRGCWNEYLLFGMDLELFINLPEMYNYTVEQLREATKKHGIVMVQSHPFRLGTVIVEPKLLDGMEIYNGNPRHDSQNYTAEIYAGQNGLLKLSGSDCHHSVDVGRGGIAVNKRVSSTRELIAEQFYC